MQILNILLTNYKSIKRAELTFDFKKYLLSGINTDGGNSTDSNGSGKTSFISGIFWLLTGKDIDGLHHSDIITWGEKEVYGEILLEHNNNKMKIIRRRTYSGSHECQVIIEKDGEFTKYNDTPTKMSTVIYNFLFPSRVTSKSKDLTELLSRIIFMSGDRVDIFSSKNVTATERMNIIYNIIDNNSMTQLEAMESILKDKVKDINTRLDVIKKFILSSAEIEKYNIEINLNNNHIKAYLDKLEEKTKARKQIVDQRTKINHSLKAIEEQRKLIELRKYEVEKDILTINTQISKIEANNNTIRLTKDKFKKNYSLAKTALQEFTINNSIEDKDYKTEIIQLSEQRVAIDIEINNTNNIIKESESIEKTKKYKCPECSQDILMLSNTLMKTSDIERLKSVNQENINKKNKLLEVQSNLKKKIKDLELSFSYLQEYQRLVDKEKSTYEQYNEYKEVETDCSELYQQRERYEKKLENIKNELKPLDISNYLNDLKKLDEVINDFDESMTDIKDKINTLNLTIVRITENLEYHTKNQELYISGQKALSIAVGWSKMLKIYRQERINQILSEFEYYSNEIFSELCEGELKFEFENLGSSSGKFKVYGKLNTDSDFRPIETFSSGECRRCGFAMSLAAREVIAPNNQLSLLILDECLDKIDESGRIKISENLNNSEVQIILVTHTADIASQFHDSIIVTKTNGESTVEIK